MASDLLSVSEIKEHVATGLSDTALERIVDSADAYILRMKGQHDPEDPDTTITYETERTDLYRMWLPRKATEIETFEERHSYLGAGWQERPEGYYRLADQGQSVLSLGRRFYNLLRVEFTPVSENAIRAEMPDRLGASGVAGHGAGIGARRYVLLQGKEQAKGAAGDTVAAVTWARIRGAGVMGKSAMYEHPNFKVNHPPPGVTREAIQWVLDSAANFISPPKEDDENDEFACEYVAEVLRGDFAGHLYAATLKERPLAQ